MSLDPAQDLNQQSSNFYYINNIHEHALLTCAQSCEKFTIECHCHCQKYCCLAVIFIVVMGLEMDHYDTRNYIITCSVFSSREK